MEYLVKTYKRHGRCASLLVTSAPTKLKWAYCAHASESPPATAGRVTLRSRRHQIATASTDGGAAWHKRQGVNVLPGKKPITDHLWPYTFPRWMDWPPSTINYAPQWHNRGPLASYLCRTIPIRGARRYTTAVKIRQAEGQRQFPSPSEESILSSDSETGRPWSHGCNALVGILTTSRGPWGGSSRL